MLTGPLNLELRHFIAYSVTSLGIAVPVDIEFSHQMNQISASFPLKPPQHILSNLASIIPQDNFHTLIYVNVKTFAMKSS